MNMILLSLGLFSVIMCGVTDGRPSANDQHWDYLMFTQIWPPTFCAGNKCSFKNVNGWNIHGLWPSRFSGGEGPEHCKTSTDFDINKLESIKTILMKQWANLKDYDKPSEFWKHEWEAHGRCAVNSPALMDELHYFNKTLNIKLNLTLDRELAKAGFVPDAQKKYSVAKILDTIESIYKVKPLIRCAKPVDNGVQSSGANLWYETRLCMDPSFKLIDCPQANDILFFQPNANLQANSRQDPGREIVEVCNPDVYLMPFKN